MRLEGKVAFISGGARGMGAAEAVLFAREGASVAIGDVLEDEGRKVVEQISETGGRAIFVPLDVTSESQWAEAVAATVTEFGKLDVLVNNAGVTTLGRVEDTTVESWDRVMAINAKGVFLGNQGRYSRDAPGRRRLHNQHIFPIGVWSAPTSQAARSTRRPRVRCGYLPRPRRFSTPGTAYGPTRCTLGPSIRLWPSPPRSMRQPSCPAFLWAGGANLMKLRMVSCSWPRRKHLS